MHQMYQNMVDIFGEEVTKRMVIPQVIKMTIISEGFSEKLKSEVSPYITVADFCELICQKVTEEGFTTSKEEVMQMWLTSVVCEIM